jgi:hypothetical protein
VVKLLGHQVRIADRGAQCVFVHEQRHGGQPDQLVSGSALIGSCVQFGGGVSGEWAISSRL